MKTRQGSSRGELKRGDCSEILTGLTDLSLGFCPNVTSEGLQTLSSLKALTFLNLVWCWSVTAEVKQALRTAIPNLTIYNQ